MTNISEFKYNADYRKMEKKKKATQTAFNQIVLSNSLSSQ